MKPDFDAPHLDPDPWGYQKHWYERRRRQLIAAMLPNEKLGCVLEIGCSSGLMTQLLAPRASQLLAVDVSAKAVELARERLQGLPQVQVLQADITRDWPQQAFTHILLCDVAYYLEQAQIRQLARNIARQATGVLLLAHWRHAFEQVATPAQAAHDLLREGTGWHGLAHYEDEDLLVDVLGADATSIARKEGIA
ncbi:class I SAM-dependent methyltransferase [Comamonas endophytica]|uniref:Nodulation S family protein n=1 Tax=Comamonas endophytica TaxID=2949090 RepID=A0ABY6GFB1_9BURK|nr:MULTISPECIES: class I SAM-dependent methyltransferase [unclassified Acidovorax]MCD2513430.1 nodulation S family protein [Acidovorax sp. D4N7]UYG53788.1 nodulation S family protein [Acidovorax sp. 5MLIR]